MSDIVDKILLVGGNFMPEMHLGEPEFTYSACEPFIKHKQEKQKLKEIRI